MVLDVLLFAQELLNVRFTLDCCDGEVELSCQFAHLIENQVYDLVLAAGVCHPEIRNRHLEQGQE
jgi:hypothetical protein